MPRWTLKFHCKRLYAAACSGNLEALADLRALGKRVMHTKRKHRRHLAAGSTEFTPPSVTPSPPTTRRWPARLTLTN